MVTGTVRSPKSAGSRKIFRRLKTALISSGFSPFLKKWNSEISVHCAKIVYFTVIFSLASKKCWVPEAFPWPGIFGSLKKTAFSQWFLPISKNQTLKFCLWCKKMFLQQFFHWPPKWLRAAVVASPAACRAPILGGKFSPPLTESRCHRCFLLPKSAGSRNRFRAPGIFRRLQTALISIGFSPFLKKWNSEISIHCAKIENFTVMFSLASKKCSVSEAFPWPGIFGSLKFSLWFLPISKKQTWSFVCAAKTCFLQSFFHVLPKWLRAAVVFEKHWV